MLKYSFYNDYSEGAHPALLAYIARSNRIQEQGYGNDGISARAREVIRKTIANPDAEIHFVSGGTQANLVVLAALLKPYESVIAAQSAHIHTHEAGAIEATGHKINVVASEDGKIRPERIQAVLDEHTDEHMVKPGAVFLSNSTELGTVYTKGELEGISRLCKTSGLYCYMDGARIGSALTSKASDLTFSDLKRLVDICTIGGTKNGALVGEAIVINHPELQGGFRYHLKQRGALLAKGRFLGAQFLCLFENDRFLTLSRHANAMADKMAQQLARWGYAFLAPPETNQIFPIVQNDRIARLQELYGFYIWKKMDEKFSAIRLVTSWATKEDVVDNFLTDFKNLCP